MSFYKFVYRTVGLPGLDAYYRFGAAASSAGSSRYLGYSVERPLGASEVGGVDKSVGIDYSHSAYRFEIKSLCYHLGAYKQPAFPLENSSIRPA